MLDYFYPDGPFGILLIIVGAWAVITICFGVHTILRSFDDADRPFDNRVTEISRRFDSVDGEINGLRQDVNYTNARLDVLIRALEAAQAIPADVVPKSTAPPSAAG